MIEVAIMGITLNRHMLLSLESGRQTATYSNIAMTIQVHTETTDMGGSAQMTEDERDALLTLLAQIEERLMDEIIRQ